MLLKRCRRNTQPLWVSPPSFQNLDQLFGFAPGGSIENQHWSSGDLTGIGALTCKIVRCFVNDSHHSEKAVSTPQSPPTPRATVCFPSHSKGTESNQPWSEASASSPLVRKDLSQWFSTGNDFVPSPWVHLTMCGDISDSHDWVGATGISWAEAKDGAEHHAVQETDPHRQRMILSKMPVVPKVKNPNLRKNGNVTI